MSSLRKVSAPIPPKSPSGTYQKESGEFKRMNCSESAVPSIVTAMQLVNGGENCFEVCNESSPTKASRKRNQPMSSSTENLDDYPPRTKSPVPDDLSLREYTLNNHEASATNTHELASNSGNSSAFSQSYNTSSQGSLSRESSDFVDRHQRPSNPDELHLPSAFSSVKSSTDNLLWALRLQNALRASKQQSNTWPLGSTPSIFNLESTTYSENSTTITQLQGLFKSLPLSQSPLATSQIATPLLTQAQLSQTRTPTLEASRLQPDTLGVTQCQPTFSQLFQPSLVSSNLNQMPGLPSFLNPYKPQIIENYSAVNRTNFTPSASPAHENPYPYTQRLVTPSWSSQPILRPAFSGVGSAISVANPSLFYPPPTAMQNQRLASLICNPLQVYPAGPRLEICRVCGYNSNGYHYGAKTCEGCKSFFGREVRKPQNQRRKCLFKGNCAINHATKRRCQECRFNKCLTVGMLPEHVHSKEGREAAASEENAKRKQEEEQEKEENWEESVQLAEEGPTTRALLQAEDISEPVNAVYVRESRSLYAEIKRVLRPIRDIICIFKYEEQEEESSSPTNQIVEDEDVKEEQSFSLTIL